VFSYRENDIIILGLAATCHPSATTAMFLMHSGLRGIGGRVAAK